MTLRRPMGPVTATSGEGARGSFFATAPVALHTGVLRGVAVL